MILVGNENSKDKIRYSAQDIGNAWYIGEALSDCRISSAKGVAKKLKAMGLNRKERWEAIKNANWNIV